MKDFEKKYRLPNRDGIKINGVIRHMTKKDLARVHKLFTDQQKKYVVNSRMSQEEIMHYLLPRPGVVWTWVIENENEKG